MPVVLELGFHKRVVHKAAAVRMVAAVVHTIVAAVHMLGAVGRKLVVVGHTAAAVAHIVVAAADCMAIEEEVDRIEVAVVAEDDRKDFAQRIEVYEVRMGFVAGKERHWVCLVEYVVAQSPDMPGKTY